MLLTPYLRLERLLLNKANLIPARVSRWEEGVGGGGEEEEGFVHGIKKEEGGWSFSMGE